MSAVSVLALSSVPVGWLLWQRPQRIPVLTVVCRATFLLRPGEVTLASEQEPPAAVERPYPDGSSRGLYAPVDLVPLKPRADVVLVGSAHAAAGTPARSLFARLAVGEVDKRIEIFADRYFDLQGELHEGKRFTSTPLTYERAAGGPDTSNPLGVRPDVRNTYGHLALPNLQPPGLEIASPSDLIAPIGFGPIASEWPGRAAFLGAGAQWDGQLVPHGLDPAYFNAAPRDQQLQSLREDERIALYNLHPQHPELVTRLPGLAPRAFVEGRAPAPQAMAMRADALWIDTSRSIVTVTWRGQVLLEHPQQAVTVLLAMETPGHPLSFDDLDRMRRMSEQGSKAGPKQTVAMPAGPQGAAPLPFSPHASQPAPSSPHAAGGLPFHTVHDVGSAPKPPDQVPAPLPVVPPKGNKLAETATASMSPLYVPALPFQSPAPAVAHEPSHAVTHTEPPLPVQIPVQSPSASPWVGAGPSAPPIVTARPLPVQPIAEPPPPPIVVPSQPASPQPVTMGETPRPPAPARTGPVDALSLVGLDPDILPRLRRDPRFTPLLDALDQQPLDPDLDHPELGEPAADIDDRREVFEILARGAPSSEEAMAAALAAAVRDDGRLVHPIVLVAGELRFPFDELAALKATLSAAAPYAGTDTDAKRILDLAREFLKTPGLPGAAAVAEGLTTRVRETFEKRALVPAGYLDAQAPRALLGDRLFQKRRIFGAPHVRAFLQTSTGEADRPAIPVYLAADLAARLPASPRLRVRMLAHVHPSAEQHEACPHALRAAALAVLTTPLLRR